MANLSGVTKYFPTPSEGYSSTLSSTIVSGATVVPVASASQYDDGDVVVLIVDPKTSDEAVFTGTKTSLPDRFIDCVWTEGNVGVGHASGAVIADYVTATHLAMVTEGLRSKERQKELVAAGASKTMNSRHITGHAVDLAAYVNGIRWDWPLYEKIAKAMKQAAYELNIKIEWGGDWKSFKDGPHIQLTWKAYP